MRRLAITTLAVLYTLLIVTATVARTSECLDQEAAGQARSHSGQNALTFGTPVKSEAHQSQKKIVEPQFVVETPREDAVVLALPVRTVPIVAIEYRSDWSGQPLSSRAPPLVI